MTDGLSERDATSFVSWMLDSVVADARGDRMQTLPVAPAGRLWLGRLAPEIVVQNSRLGERSERLEPCEVGVRLRLSEVDGRTIRCFARLVAWSEIEDADEDDPEAARWRKSEPVEVTAPLGTPTSIGTVEHSGRADFAAALAAIGASGLECEFHAEMEQGKDGLELVVTVVNISPEELPGWDTNLYEVSLQVDAGPTEPFTLTTSPTHSATTVTSRRTASTEVSSGSTTRPSAPPTSRYTTSLAPLTGTTPRTPNPTSRSPLSPRTRSPRSVLSSRPHNGGAPTTGPRPPWTAVRVRRAGATGCASRLVRRRSATPTRWRG
jgi:hypothetical protein